MKIFTLAAMGALTVASLTAHAQFTLDGKATAAEIGTGVGKYQLAGTYGGTHLDPDRGLRAMYVGYTSTTLNIMLVGSGESATAGAYRAFILYLNTPARPGAPATAALPGGLDPSSPLAHHPRLDQEADYGLRMVVSPSGMTDVFYSAVSYVTGSGTSPVGTDPYVGSGTKTGTATVSTTAVLTGTRFAYFNTQSLAANTTAVNSGLEIEIPLVALGGTAPTAGSRIDLFAAYTDSNGQFVTADVIPEVTGRTTAFGTDPNFATIPGTQSLGFVLGAGVLASRSAVADGFAFQVYPNPASATSTIAYTVPAGRQPVSLAVYNALGQRVRAWASAEQAGSQQLALGSLPAGAYLVKLQIGDQLTSRKIVVQ